MVKGFVAQLAGASGGGKDKQGGGGGGAAAAAGGGGGGGAAAAGTGLLAAAPLGVNRNGTKPPKVRAMSIRSTLPHDESERLIPSSLCKFCFCLFGLAIPLEWALFTFQIDEFDAPSLPT